MSLQKSSQPYPAASPGQVVREKLKRPLTATLSPQDIEALEEIKKTERPGNVYENKEGLWKTQGRSGNVIENKYSYASNPGMLLKGKVL